MSDIQSINNEHFNKIAQEYDAIPQAEEMTTRASEVIVQEFTASTSEERLKIASTLDFGCGTGLCAFKVAPHVKNLLGVDASEGMLKHLHHKLSTNAENVDIRDKIKTVNHLVTKEAPLPEPEFSQYLAGSQAGFDLVYSSAVMHHIEDVQGIIDTLAQKLLKKDGWLIVLDFEGAHGHHLQHGEGTEGHAHGHGHEHGHDDHHHGHGDHAHHGHHHGDHKEGEHKPQDIRGHFTDEDGKPLEHVAHMEGFTPEGFAEIFKKAGLVEVSAKHAFGMNRSFKGKQVWTDVLVVKGRRA